MLKSKITQLSRIETEIQEKNSTIYKLTKEINDKTSNKNNLEKEINKIENDIKKKKEELKNLEQICDSELQKKITVGSNDEILIELNEDKDSETDINSTE